MLRFINWLQRIARTDIRYLTKGLFWFGVQHGTSIVGALATSVVFANVLPKEIYGTYRYILSIFGILMIAKRALSLAPCWCGCPAGM